MIGLIMKLRKQKSELKKLEKEISEGQKELAELEAEIKKGNKRLMKLQKIEIN